MGFGRYSKGANFERELLERFHKHGFSGVRVAGSGTARFPCPDLLVGKNNSIFAVEVKGTKDNKLYVSNEKLKQVIDFAENFGCTPVLAIKFIGKNWCFFNLKNFEFSSKRNQLFTNTGACFELFLSKCLNLY